MFKVNTQYLAGAVVGVAAAAGGFYLYKKNQPKVDNFLRSHGINVPGQAGENFRGMGLEELVVTKEKIEDIIAEREISENNTPASK